MIYTEVIQIIGNNIINYFDEVYHSAEIIVNDKNIRIPAVAMADEWVSLAPSDQHETIYIRRNGDDEMFEEMKVSGCVKSYKMRSPLRVVYFKDHAKNHDEIIAKLLQSVLINSTKLKSVIRDKWKLLKDESSGDYNFGATTAYFAIDIYALWHLIPDNCINDFCVNIDNPIKSRRCLVVA